MGHNSKRAMSPKPPDYAPIVAAPPPPPGPRPIIQPLATGGAAVPGGGTKPAEALAALGEMFETLMRRAFTGCVRVSTEDGVPTTAVKIEEMVNIRLSDGIAPSEAEIRSDLARLHRLFEDRYALRVKGNTEIRFERGRAQERARCEFYEEIRR